VKLKALFISSLVISLHSCGGAITSASLIESLISPHSIAMSLVDYGIEKETGKKVSEHALSAVTSKDCKFDFTTINVCKDDIIDYLSVNVVANIKNSYISKIE